MDDTQRTGWQKRILLFLTSQCITLFGSTLVQMALVWYATMQTSSGAWVAAFTVCSYLPQFLISFIGFYILDSTFFRLHTETYPITNLRALLCFHSNRHFASFRRYSSIQSRQCILFHYMLQRF